MRNQLVKLAAAAAALALASCGAPPKPAVVPVLPGDGDANVAKPPPPPKPVVTDAWSGRTDLLAPPTIKAPQPVVLPPIQQFTLKDGLQVYVIKSDKLPVVSMQLAIRAGRANEPRARLGVSEFTADMLVKGTAKHDALGLAKAIDFVGGTIAADATFEATLISCSVLSRNLSTCLDLIPEIVISPSFPDGEIAKVRDQLIGGVKQRLDDANTLASAHVQNLLWGNEHVRGWINNEASINALRRDDLVAWHKTWFVPGNSLLVVTGDVDAKKLQADLERGFAGWAKAPVPPSPKFTEPGLSGIRIRLVDKPGQTQTHIRVAQFGIKHEDPRFFDSLVWNYVLGGGEFSSRLMKVVRVQGGKTYGASSAFDRNADRGSFVAQTFTRNSEAIATTKLLTAEIAKMAKDGPNAAEVQGAIANIAGGYGLRFQSAADVGAALVAAELHGFGKEYLANYPIQIGAVTVASAKTAASEILDPKDYVVVMVGDAKDLEPQLKKEGWRYEKVAFTDPITPEVKGADGPADPKAMAATKQVLADALVAKGGKAKLQAVKSMRLVADGTTAIQGQTVPVVITRELSLPDRMRIDATLDLGQKVTVEVGVDGKVGWQLAPDGLHDIPPEELASVEFERWREPELILLRPLEPSTRITPQADDLIDSKPQSVVKISSPFGIDVVLYIDKKTKLLTRMTYIDGKALNTDDFADYRDVKGLKIAHKRISTGGGRNTQLTMSKVEIDPAIDAARFAKPAAPAAPAPAPAAPAAPAPSKP